MDIAETIRSEISRAEKRGRTRYQIAQDLKKEKVTEAQLCRLMKGKTLTAETMGILLNYFGYELKKKVRQK